ncbi:hypothetical protein PsAD13_03597 [Pseudovibrio sp. Ad13]|uniref:hypothetical protein n=1 Tax=Pseudovibrio sp. Ad13 TaxID=989396 RepID=UPI0007AEC786|nr:hypothetical protein [Pseudovibrio sp. Ad13]KZK82051.1 hypothetical protein PsAD13_03597 [Pseudovibrio sp. Ad13]
MYYVKSRPDTVAKIFYAVGIIITVISLISFVIGIMSAWDSYDFWVKVTGVFFAAGTGVITGLSFIAVAQVLYFLRKCCEELEELNRNQRRKA